MALASAGPYASLHLAPDRQPRQNSTTQFFTGRMPFLPPNRVKALKAAQSAEGCTVCMKSWQTYLSVVYKVLDAAEEPHVCQAYRIASSRRNATTKLNRHWSQKELLARNDGMEFTTAAILTRTFNRLIKNRRTAMVHDHTNVLCNNNHGDFLPSIKLFFYFTHNNCNKIYQER